MKKLGYIGAALALPFLTFAQAVTTTTGSIDSIQKAGGTLIDIINKVLVPVVFALAFFVFIWGIFRYFIAGGHDEEARESGKQLMLWGLLGFFVMIAVWGLVNILVGTLNLNTAVPQYPTAPYTATQN